ncbi:MAG: hypothetical protein ACRD30_11235 [Bryobacteraceae bacterium]
MNFKKLSSMFSAALLVAGVIALAPRAKADQWNRRTIVTFHQPVEIPGMVLGPGTYIMQLADTADRDVVQVFNKSQTRIFNTVMTIPVYRTEPTGKTVFTFYERAANSPQAIKDWYYPGELYGEQFVYPKARTVAVQPHSNTFTPRTQAAAAPAPALKPVEVAKAEPAPTPAPAPESAPAPAPQAKPAAAKKLPKTASDIPLLALLGGFSLAAGVVIRKFAA